MNDDSIEDQETNEQEGTTVRYDYTDEKMKT